MPTYTYLDTADDQVKQRTIENKPLSESILYVGLRADTTDGMTDLVALTDQYGRITIDGRVTRETAQSILSDVNQYRQNASDGYRRHTRLDVVNNRGEVIIDAFADFNKLNFFQSNHLDANGFVVVSYWGDPLFRTTRKSFEQSGLDFLKDDIPFARIRKILRRKFDPNETLPDNMTMVDQLAVIALSNYKGKMMIDRYAWDSDARGDDE
ncbi:MAG: hypothetical protein K8L99_02525 [Anaerolineae bacterium]|nr:hypothetical protein [Anaerolineae bacterium]